MTECLFCLEGETPEAGSLITFDFNIYDFACQCKIHTHSNCWMNFTTHKGRSECPICHKVFITYAPAPRQAPHIIFIVNNPVYRNEQPAENRVIFNRKIKYSIAILLLITIILFVVFIIIR